MEGKGSRYLKVVQLGFRVVGVRGFKAEQLFLEEESIEFFLPV